MDERRLIARVLKGDPAAERQLYDGHVDQVFRLAYRMVGDDAMAEDLTQDIFLRAFDRLPRFRGDAKFSTWLYTIAVSVILNRLRKAGRDRRREESWADMRPSRNNPDLMRRIQAAIDQLSDPLRVVFVMHEVEGFMQSEIAEILNLPSGTVKARLSRAKAALRETLQDDVSGVEAR